MGFLGKVFKPIKKVFKGIGKFIKKAFKGFGKFMNKLGIFGQIGMMFIMPGLANVALKGLTQLGSGFMAGLGKVAASQSALSGIAKVSHAVLTTAANTARAGMSGFRTITDTVVGTVTDTARAMGSKMGGGAFEAPLVDATTGEVLANKAGGILENAANRLQAGAKRTWGNLTDAAKSAGHIMPGGPEYAPDVQKYQLQEDRGLFGGRKRDIVERDIKYTTQHREDFDAFKATGDKLPPPENKDFISQHMVDPFRQNTPDTKSVATSLAVSEAAKLAQRDRATAEDDRLGLLERGSTDRIAMETEARGIGVPLPPPITTEHKDSQEWNLFASSPEFIDSFLAEDSFTNNEWSRVIQQKQRGQTPTFQGSYAYG